MKAIITGATGFLGSHLVTMLEDHDYSIIALGRNVAKGTKLNSKQTVFKVADITELKSLETAFEQVDIVFHCAALSSDWGNPKEFRLTNIEGSRNVLSCCETFSVKRLVYVSSTSVYFNFKDKINITEDQVLQENFANIYASTKYFAERLLLTERKTTEVVIIRPRGIVGEGDTSIMPRILRIANKGFFPLINNGQAIIDITYVKNVAYALYLAAEKENINGRIYNISNLEPLSVKELLKRILYQREHKVIFIPVTYSIMYGLAWVLEFITKAFSLETPMFTRYSIALLSKTQQLNTEAAQQELGYKPLYSLNCAIDRYLQWEKRNA